MIEKFLIFKCLIYKQCVAYNGIDFILFSNPKFFVEILFQISFSYLPFLSIKRYYICQFYLQKWKIFLKWQKDIFIFLEIHKKTAILFHKIIFFIL